MKTADANNVRLIIANDPDSDRLAAAEKLPRFYSFSFLFKFSSGEWKIFTGNEIGILLGHWAWTQYKAKHPSVDPGNLNYV